MRSVATLMAADTQAVEAVNSIIKLLGQRAPNISLELLSSRLTIKHFLSHCDGSGKLGGKKKWKLVHRMLENEVQILNSSSTATLAIMCEGDRWTIAPSVSFPISDTGGTGGESELPIADYDKSMALVTAVTRTMQQKTSCATRPSEEPAPDQPEQPAPDLTDQPDADATGHDHGKVSSEEMLGADKSDKSDGDGEAGEADRFSKEAFQWAKSYNLGWKRGTRVPKKKKKQHKGKGNKDNGEAGEAGQQKNTGATPDGAAPDDASHVDGVSAGVQSLASAMFVIAILILGLT